MQRVVPIELHSFDVETKSWTDGGDVLVVEPFHYCGFASIV